MEIKRKTKIALFIPTLALGGSERQLVELARGLDQSRWDVLVLTMYSQGALLNETTAIPGVRVVSFEKSNSLIFLWVLMKKIQEEKTDILFSYLSTAQLYAVFVKILNPKIKLIFRIGDSIKAKEYSRFKNIMINAALNLFRNVPDFYIFNSQAGQASKSLPMALGKTKIVHNGVDTKKFQPSHILREKTRKILGIAEETILVGLLGNFTFYKGHKTFIQAANIVRKSNKNVHFLTIGNHDTVFGKEAMGDVRAMNMESCFTFLGIRQDVEEILPALDIGSSSSNMAEGFSNGICELMACGVPCVVTDVGDASLIVANTGIIVPKDDPTALAQGLSSMVGMSSVQRKVLGQKSRDRILEQFPVSKMVTATEQICMNL